MNRTDSKTIETCRKIVEIELKCWHYDIIEKQESVSNGVKWGISDENKKKEILESCGWHGYWSYHHRMHQGR
jgi:hypothetical protein